MKRLYIIFAAFLFSSALMAQGSKKLLEYGDVAYKKGDYATALMYYLKVINKEQAVEEGGYIRPYEIKPYKGDKKITDSIPKASPTADNSDHYLVHQIADSYRLNHDYANAEIWFKKSVDNKSSKYPYERYYYGDALMKNKKYSDATEQFDVVMTDSEKKDSVMFKQAKLKIAGCYLAIDTLKNKSAGKIKLLDSVFNKGTSTFAANYYGDINTVQFTSAREGNTVSAQSQEEAKYSADIYMASKTDKTAWGSVKKIDIPVNTDDQEGAGFLTVDRSSYFFTRWSTTNRNESAIYLSRLVNDVWAAPVKLGDNINVEGYKTMHPALSADATILYFSSNRPGGFGGMDLWSVKIDEEGKAQSSPVNMGPIFNTSEDEVTPFFHSFTSTLYFSSNGHPGFGGLDIFKSSFNLEDGVWSLVKNIGAPYNSSRDDAYYVLERSQQHGFFTSDREGCGDCGSCYKAYEIEKLVNTFDLTGTVYNAETNEVIPSALITLKDIRGDKEPFYLVTDSEGRYFTALDESVELYLKAQKTKFFGDAGTVTTIGLTESAHLSKDFFLSPIPKGDIVIPGIEYDLDKATLRPASKKILDDLYDFLVLNNDLSIEINSHTDERGSDKYNMKLSQERAKSCVDYLIGKGIAVDRLLAKGYGETKLLVEHAQTEEEHQRNRRTAFRPLKQSEIIK